MTERANETRGEATITFEGVDYVMRPSWEAIDTIEQALGKSTEELASGAYDNKLTRHEKATIIGEFIRAWGKQTGDATASGVNDRRIKELIAEEGSLIIGKKIGLLLYTAVTGGLTGTGSKAGDDDDAPALTGTQRRRRYAGIAGAAFHWTPRDFWTSTPSEFFAAFEIWQEMNTPKKT